MANLSIPDEQTYVSFAVTTANAGPFPFTFSIFSKANLRVSVDGLELSQEQFSFSGVRINSGFDGGSITLNSKVQNSKVLIWRDIATTRTTDFSASGIVPVKDMDAEFDRLTAISQDAKRDMLRSLRLPIDEVADVLPAADVRANRVLECDEDGRFVLKRALGEEGAPGVSFPGFGATAGLATEGNDARLTAGVRSVSTIESLEAEAAPSGATRFLNLDERSGLFRLVDGTKPSDSLKGLYVSSATSGKYWARVWDGVNGRPEWFGAARGGPDCLAAILACIALCQTTTLAIGDYWISDTLKINTSWRTVRGGGVISYDTGQGTRLLLADGSKTIVQIGPDTNPGGNPGTTYIRQVSFEAISVTRAASNTNNVVVANNPRAVLLNYAYRCSISDVAAWESNIGFQFYGCVSCTIDDCLAFRSAAGGENATNGMFYGFHCVGDPPVLAGGNASLYMTRCTANCAGLTTLPKTAGFRLEGAFVDTFLFQPETVGARNGIWVTGSGPSAATNTNIDLHIINAIVDQPSEFGIHLESLNVGAMVEIVSAYMGLPGSGTGATLAGIYIENGSGNTSILGGQIVTTSGAADTIGLYLRAATGIHVDGFKIADAPRPVFVDTCVDVSLNVKINSPGISAANSAINLVGTTRAVITPSIRGKANNFTAGVALTGTGNTLVEVGCTLIDPACISGGSTNKLTSNGTAITAVGAFGTNSLASGIMV